MPRPLFNLSISQLEALFEASKNNASWLRQIADELSHRSTTGSIRLKMLVDAALATAGRSASSASRPPDVDAGSPKSAAGSFGASSREVVAPSSPQARAAKLKIAELRNQLLDLSNRNRLLNFKHTARGSRQVRIVDESILDIFRQLQGAGTVELVDLPAPPDQPDDEGEEEFVEALEEALLTDKAYLKAVAKIENEATDDSEAKLRKAERSLRDRVRKKLGWASRHDATPSLEALASRFGINPSYELSGRHKRRRPQRHWQTLLSEEELGRRLRGIVQQTNEAREEYGLETLHFAFGFLEWYPPAPDGASEEPIFSPLVLQPINVEHKRSGRGTSRANGRELLEDPELRPARAHGETFLFSGGDSENPAVNLTLRVRLQQDCQIALPELDGEEPNLEVFFAQVEDAIRHQPKWRLRRFATLTHLSFSRLAMWLDLDPAAGGRPTHQHPILAELFGGREAVNDDEPAENDAKSETGVPVLVADCDSSQYAAIRTTLQGKNLVVQGPPGTGKSQMISNLIAAALHEGKSVLFVAEKMAALDVVHKRLTEAGLGDFLLELHSAKSGKKPVLESIQKRLALSSWQSPREHLQAVEERRQVAERLHSYADAVNTSFGRSGWTVHDLVWRNFGFRNQLVPHVLQTFDFPEVESLTPDDIEVRIKALGDWHGCKARYAIEAAKYDGTHPWAWVKAADLHVAERIALVQQVRHLGQSLTELGDWNAKHWITRKANPSASDFGELMASLTHLGTRPAEISRELWELAADRKQEQEIDDVVAAIESLRIARGTIQRIAPEAITAPAVSKKLVANLSAELGRFQQHDIDVNARLAANEELQRLAKETHAMVERLAEFFGNQRPAAIGAHEMELLATLAVLAANAPSEMAGCLHRLGEPEAVPQVQKATARLRQLRARQRDIQTSLKIPFESLNGDEARNAQREFATAWFGSWLFNPNFRSACRFALRVAPDVPRKERAAFLASIEQLIGERAAWCNDSQVSTIAGTLFRGTETDVEHLDQACEWILRVRQATPASEHLSIVVRNLLFGLSEELHATARKILDQNGPNQISALAETCRTRSCSLVELVETLTSEHKSLKAIQDRCARLDWRGALSASRVGEVTVAINEVERSGEILAANQDVARLLGSDPTQCLSQIHEVRSAISRVEKTLLPAAWTQRLSAHDSAVAWGEITNLKKELTDHVDAIDAGRRNIEHLAGGSCVTTQHWQNQSLEDLARSLRECSDLEDLLITRAQLLAAESAIEAVGLKSFVARLIPGIEFADLKELFSCIVVRSMCRRALAAHPVLQSFRHTSPREVRDRFQLLDTQLKKRDQNAVVAKLLGRHIPAGNGIGLRSTWTDLALLRHTAGLERPRISLRALIRRSGRALQAMKPCFMMSPLSVAQLVERGTLEFDLVVFDEASQVRPEDALCALARGKQFVVVGDQMQLPPTSFGEKTVSEAGIDDEGDGDSESAVVESILETAAATYSDHKMLLWHYRSQDPALIAFSNQEFYKDLKLFPAPRTQHPASGIKYVWVGGTYSARTNVEEAQQCAAAAVEFMRHYPERSLGIVALNRPQADLINLELERLINDRPNAVDYRAKWSTGLEPLFVKNLENVQGDERDVIFISTVFGVDADGNFIQRFGPINSKVGHRRLNVLFTRAKHQLVLFTSMPVEKIVTTEKHWGVRALKQYLEFAKSGRLQSGRPTGRSADSPFETSVRSALETAGYQCEPQVGVAGFFIDLAVKHPSNPDEYLLGVECDGASYHSSRSARDRDRLRQEILERMGWRIHRVWSTDWFSDPKGQLQRLLAVIHELKSKPPIGHERSHLDYSARFGKRPAANDPVDEKTASPSTGSAPSASPSSDSKWVKLIESESYAKLTRTEIDSVSNEHLRALLKEAFTLPPQGPVLVEIPTQQGGWFAEVKIGENYNRAVYLWFNRDKQMHLGSMPWVEDAPLSDNLRLRAQAVREVIARWRKPSD